MPKRLFIENKRDSGYFLVEFPRVELYQMEHAYVQKCTLSTRDVFELLRLNFENRDSYLRHFDQERCLAHVRKCKSQLLDQKALDLYPEEQISPGAVALHSTEDVHTFEELPHPRIVQREVSLTNPAVDTIDEERIDMLAITINDVPGVQEHDHNWAKKVLKQTLVHRERKFIVTLWYLIL